MKSVINTKPAPEAIPFPKLMVGNVTGVVYLMQSNTKGLCVNVGNSIDGAIGDSFDCLDSRGFSDFEGSVELSN